MQETVSAYAQRDTVRNEANRLMAQYKSKRGIKTLEINE
jgi:hypothetical protein